MLRILDCTELPVGWKYKRMEIDPDFPIDNGVAFSVSCKNRYIDVGSLKLTCNTDIYGDIEYKEKLNCFPRELK